MTGDGEIKTVKRVKYVSDGKTAGGAAGSKKKQNRVVYDTPRSVE